MVSKLEAGASDNRAPARWELYLVELFGVVVEQLRSFRIREVGRDFVVGVPERCVVAEQAVDREVRGEHAAVGTENVDRIENKRCDRSCGPLLIEHAESRDFRRYVRGSAEGFQAFSPLAQLGG